MYDSTVQQGCTFFSGCEIHVEKPEKQSIELQWLLGGQDG